MKIMLVAVAAFALSGCALFEGPERTAAVRIEAAPAAPQRVAREPFRPAFAAGEPVALVPCRGAARLSDGCRSLKTWHEIGGGMPDADETTAIRDASAKADD